MPIRRRYAAIVNPQSANGRTEADWPRIAESIRKRVGDFESWMCEHPGHATELTRNALKAGCNRVISVGGDGTHNEVVNGFFEQGKRVNARASLAILPQGTASDFARTLGVSDRGWALTILDSEHELKADVGRMEFKDLDGNDSERYFLNVAHFGLGGTVAELANESSKAVRGRVPYVIASLKTLARLEAFPMRLRLDRKKVEGWYIDVILANGRYFGGGVEVGEDIRFNSGSFDVLLVCEMTRAQAIARLRTLYGGTVEDIDRVAHYPAKRIQAQADVPVPINLDGEFVGHLPAQASLVHGGIRIVTGRACEK